MDIWEEKKDLNMIILVRNNFILLKNKKNLN